MRICINAWMIILGGNQRPSKHFFINVGTEPLLPVYYQHFSGSKCVFAQEHNATLVGIEPPIWSLGLYHWATALPCRYNGDMHKRLEQFVFWPDPTTDCGIICPLTSEKSMYNNVTTLMRFHFLSDLCHSCR